MRSFSARLFCRWLAAFVAMVAWIGHPAVSRSETPADSVHLHLGADKELAVFLDDYCIDCHGPSDPQGDLDLSGLLGKDLGHSMSSWENVVRRLSTRQMPPVGESRPEETTYNAMTAKLEKSLDQYHQSHPDIAVSDTFRRLNQTEYRNAIRDLLAIEVDVSEMLPQDESSHGFDNVTVTGLSPTLMDRYVLAAQKMSRLAVGYRAEAEAEHIYRVPADVTQDTHLPNTPIGTRGGLSVRHLFPQSGQYEIQVWLMRDRNDEVESLRGKHELEVALNGQRKKLFEISKPERGISDQSVDEDLTVRLDVPAGPQDISVAFLNGSASLLETVRQPLNVHFNFYRHPRIGPAVFQVSVRGPYQGKAAAGTPSRERVLGRFANAGDAVIEPEVAARQLLGRLMRLAYRREVNAADFHVPMRFFKQGQAVGGFDAGVERALGAILCSPHFLFRIERAEPTQSAAKQAAPKKLSDYELASRLSFFLWSSIPDDQMLDLAEAGRLGESEVLRAQVKRMLADSRSRSLVENFAAQWLYLRNLDSVKPDMRRYPDFDDNLRDAFRQETELFLTDIIRNDRSILDILRADFTYLNERLAKHYEIPHIYGSRFRRVPLSPDSRRGGLLRQGSVLSVTSYATRTSPVIRGNWVLENILGSSPPPPPPDVPTLQENTVSASLPLRKRLEQHRADEACASCHDLMDPIGFALENYDAIGRWRETEDGEPLAVSGRMADGQEIDGVAGLEQALLNRPELFARTVTEKLMTFALGRGLQHHDAPAVRQVVRSAKENNYRFSEIIVGITESQPFLMRKSP